MATQNSISLKAGTNITLTPSSTGLTIAATGGSSSPQFNAYVNANVIGATGDGTAYTVLFNTVLSNVGSHYVAGTGIFTAPTTGQYLFSGSVYIRITGVANETALVNLTTTGFNYIANFQGGTGDIGSGQSPISLPFSIITTMTAGDTAKVVLTGSNGIAGTMDVLASGTYWGAYLIG